MMNAENDMKAQRQSLSLIVAMVRRFPGLHPDNHVDDVNGCDLVDWINENLGEFYRLKEHIRGKVVCESDD